MADVKALIQKHGSAMGVGAVLGALLLMTQIADFWGPIQNAPKELTVLKHAQAAQVEQQRVVDARQDDNNHVQDKTLERIATLLEVQQSMQHQQQAVPSPAQGYYVPPVSVPGLPPPAATSPYPGYVWDGRQWVPVAPEPRR